MTSPASLVFASLVLGALVVEACSPPARVCTPGMSITCVGGGGCVGGQVCNAEGAAFGACDCGGARDAGVDASARVDAGGDAGVVDGGTDGGPASCDPLAAGPWTGWSIYGCRTDADCDDQRACTIEHCDTRTGLCMRQPDACPSLEHCVEGGGPRNCRPCAEDDDGDDDGHADIRCGGDDCNDYDFFTHPGIDEVCYPGTTDNEDCDLFLEPAAGLQTLSDQTSPRQDIAVADHDRDGLISGGCCNAYRIADQDTGGVDAGVGPVIRVVCGTDEDDDCPRLDAGTDEAGIGIDGGPRLCVPHAGPCDGGTSRF